MQSQITFHNVSLFNSVTSLHMCPRFFPHTFSYLSLGCGIKDKGRSGRITYVDSPELTWANMQGGVVFYIPANLSHENMYVRRTIELVLCLS